MDYQRNIQLLLIWVENFRMVTLHVACLVVYYYIIKNHSRSRTIDHSLTLEKDRVREKIMKKIATDEGCNIVRMSPKAFSDLCVVLQREGGLRPTQRVTIEEQVAETLYILTQC